jgi:hypothetical protein
MSSTPNPGRSNPNHVALAALRQACQRMRKPAPPRRSWFGGLALRGLMGLLVAACMGAAATTLMSPGDAAKQLTEQWEPQLYLISSSAATTPISAQSSPPAVRASDPKAAPPLSGLPAPAAETPLRGSASTAGGPPPEQEQTVQLLRGFLDIVEQDIEELKTSIEQLKTSQEQMVRNNSAVGEQLKAAQEQMVRDNAAVAEQLRATQQQIARFIIKDSEQQLRPKTPTPPLRSIATATGKPAPKLSSPQARAQPSASVRGRPE